jgi:hypothetical protein
MTKQPFKRGTRVFVAQAGFPQYGQHATIVRRVPSPTTVPGDRWYSYRVDGAKKPAGLIVHESWLSAAT